MRSHIPSETLEALHERSKGICEQCHRVPAAIPHHILPVLCGGSHALSNLLHVCDACHARTHPWLSENGLRTACYITGKDEIATYYGSMKARKKNVILLEKYSKEDIESAFAGCTEKS